MASPQMTFGTVGNILTSASIALSATRAFDVDFSAKIEGQIQIAITFGTVAATSGLQIDIFATVGGGSTVDSIALATYVIPSTASTTKTLTIKLPPGKYHGLQTNLDATNGLTVNTVTTATIDTFN